MEKLLMIDLCSGLGGASQPFIDRGWEVIRIDNNPKFSKVARTITGSVKEIEKIIPEYILESQIKPTFVWASPPCNHFSVASIHLHWTKRRRPKHIGVINAIRTVVWCLDAIEYLKPKYWALENPRDKLRNILNEPGSIFGGLKTDLGLWGAKSPKPTDIWGLFPEITLPYSVVAQNKNNLELNIGDVSDLNIGNVYQVSKYGNAKKSWNNQSSRVEMRALIPYKFSESIAIAIENELEIQNQCEDRPDLLIGDVIKCLIERYTTPLAKPGGRPVTSPLLCAAEKKNKR